MKSRFAVAIILTVVSPLSAFAWNSLGHKVVAEIAWRQLTPVQRQSIVDTLRRHPRFDTDFVAKMDDDAAKGDKAKQDHWIFQHAATWPDIIRDDKERDRPTWHYINLPQYLEDSDRVAFADKPPANFSTDYPGITPREKYNVVQAIQLWEAIVPPGGGPPPHVHSREEEGFYILDGEITLQIGDQRMIATSGMFVNMPIGVPHSFKNESTAPAKMLIMVAPAGLEQMFSEVGVPLPEGSTTALPPTQDEIEKLLKIAPKYGVEILVPHP